MIESQTINGRKATIAYIGADFTPTDADHAVLAKIIFADGDMLFLDMGDGSAEGDAESRGYARHRERHRQTPDAVAAGVEVGGFARHRHRHRRPVEHIISPVKQAMPTLENIDAPPPAEHTEAPLPERKVVPGDPPTVESDNPTVPPNDTDIMPVHEDVSIEHHLAAWAKAVVILDKSEVLVRDVIERVLAPVTSKPDYGVKLVPMGAIIRSLMAQIRPIRTEAIKTAFRLVRDTIGDRPILNAPLSTWAAALLAHDLKQIEIAITNGLIDRLDNAEIARKVVGSMGLNGVDGVTEYTRHKIAHLGRAGIRELQYRAAKPA